MLEEYYPNESLLQILLLTGLLGCGCAWLTGRAIAITWRSVWQVFGAMVLLGFGMRFIHFVLFEGPLTSLSVYLFETALLTLVALIAYRYTRTSQMVRQYYWLYERQGPLGWRLRQNAPAENAS